MVEATGRKGGKLYASQRQTTMGVTLKAVLRPLRKWQSTKVAGVDRYRQIIRRMNLKDIVQAHASNSQKLSASTFMIPPLSIASFLQRRLTGDIMLKAGSLRCSRLAKNKKECRHCLTVRLIVAPTSVVVRTASHLSPTSGSANAARKFRALTVTRPSNR